MRAAGVNIVTVGIFSWARLEPRAGRASTSGGSTRCSTCCTQRHRRRPRHADRLPAALARACRTRRRCPVDRGRRPAGRGVAQQYCPRLRSYRERAPRDHARPRRALRRPPRGAPCGTSTTSTAATSRLRRRRRRAFRVWLRDATGRSTRSTTRGAPRSGRSATATSTGPAAAARALPRQPGAGARLPPVHVRPAADAATEQRDVIRAPARPAGDDELHGASRRRRLWSWARRGRRRRRRPIPRPATTARRRHRAHRRTSCARSAAGALGAHGAGDQRASTGGRSNLPKTPAVRAADSLQAVARGADAICFFQWRQSRGRRRAIPLGDAPARRRRHRGVRGRLRARRRSAAAAAGRRRAGRGIRRPAVRLAVLVGGDRARTADGPARDRGAGRAGGTARCGGAASPPTSSGRATTSPATGRARAAVVHRRDGCRGRPPRRGRGRRELVVGPFSGVADATRRILQGARRCCCATSSGSAARSGCGLPDEPTPLDVDRAGRQAPRSTRRDRPESSASGFARGCRRARAIRDRPPRGPPAITRHRVGARRRRGTSAPSASDDVLAAVIDDALDAAGVAASAAGCCRTMSRRSDEDPRSSSSTTGR